MAKRKRVRSEPEWTPTSDKEIASVFLAKAIRDVVSDVDYGEIRDIAGKNIYDSRIEKIVDRINERAETLLKPVDRYLEGRQK